MQLSYWAASQGTGVLAEFAFPWQLLSWLLVCLFCTFTRKCPAKPKLKAGKDVPGPAGQHQTPVTWMSLFLSWRCWRCWPWIILLCCNSKADFCFINQMQQIQPTFLTFCLHLLERIYCLFRAPRTGKRWWRSRDWHLRCKGRATGMLKQLHPITENRPTQNKRSRCFRTSKFPSSAGSCSDTYWLGICAPWGAKRVRHALDHNVIGNHAVLQRHSEDWYWMAWRLAAWRLIPKRS